MKAYQLIKYGPSKEAFKTIDVKTPEINDDELLVKVKAAGINPVDIKMRLGMIPSLDLPTILGYDFSGVVEKVGKNVTRFKIGDEVYSAGANPHDKGGSYAEYTAVNERLAAIKPKNITFVEAASIPLVGITAYEAIFEKLNLQEKEDILIHGGTGGVGSIAIQLAKLKGAEVYSTISSLRKKKIVESLGAISIDYTEECFVRYAKNLPGSGFTKIFDTVGGKVFQESLGALKPYGQIASILNVFDESLDLRDRKSVV